MQIGIASGITNLACGLIIILVSVPLAKRKIKKNRWYGMRVAKAFESDEHWYKINEYGGKQFALWSIPILVCGIICFLVPIENTNDPILFSALAAGPTFLFMLIATIRLLRYSGKL